MISEPEDLLFCVGSMNDAQLAALRARLDMLPTSPEELLAVVAAMDKPQLGRFCLLLAKADGMRELRALYMREAQAAIKYGHQPAISSAIRQYRQDAEREQRRLANEGPAAAAAVALAGCVRVFGVEDPSYGLVAAGVYVESRRDGQTILRLLDITVSEPVWKAFMGRYGDVVIAWKNTLRLLIPGQPGTLDFPNCVVATTMPETVKDGKVRVPEVTILSAGTVHGLVEGLAAMAKPPYVAQDVSKENASCFCAELDEATRKEVLINGWAEPITAPPLLTDLDGVPHAILPLAVRDDIELDRPVETNRPVLDLDQRIEALDNRWLRATARWQRLFGDPGIPTHYAGGTADELDVIEGILYDKETRGIEPARCPCGCGYVISCGRR
jgi:hypothetical protein